MFHKIPVFAVVKVVTRNVRPASIAVASINRYSGQSLYRQFSEAAGKAPANAASQNNESAEAAVEAKVVDPLVQLQQQNAALQEEVKTLKDKLLRSYAEEENVRRIALKDVNAAKDYANTKFAKSLLDVADNLERAIGSIEQEQRTSADPHFLNLLQGVEMTQKGLTKVFESHGIVKFGAIGELFDPAVHDALCNIPDPSKASGTIAQLMKPGYKLKDRVIRAAEVATVA